MLKHPGRAHFLFADGHVQFISESINEGLYKGMATIKGGESLGSF